MIKRQRASQNQSSISKDNRYIVRDRYILQLLKGEITQGEALKSMRLEILGINQSQYAKLAKISVKTLSDLENNKGNYSVDTINQAFRPFKLQLGIVPIERRLITELFLQG